MVYAETSHQLLKEGEAMTMAIIILLLVIVLFEGYKWLKWKITAFSAIAFTIENFREPTEEEHRHYVKFVLRKMLHFSEGDKSI